MRPTRASCRTRGRWRERDRRRPPRADRLARRPDRLSAGDGPAPGRADRRSGVGAALLRLGAGATERRRSCVRPARAPTSSSAATRHGVRTSASSAPTICPCPASPSVPVSRRWPLAGRERDTAVRVPAPRSRRRAGVLGRRRGVHGDAEAAADGTGASRASVRRSRRLGRARADQAALRGRLPGTRRTSTG